MSCTRWARRQLCAGEPCHVWKLAAGPRAEEEKERDKGATLLLFLLSLCLLSVRLSAIWGTTADFKRSTSLSLSYLTIMRQVSDSHLFPPLKTVLLNLVSHLGREHLRWQTHFWGKEQCCLLLYSHILRYYTSYEFTLNELSLVFYVYLRYQSGGGLFWYFINLKSCLLIYCYI